MAQEKTDGRTGRPLGDHGTAADAVDFALEAYDPDMLGQEAEFLAAWRDGSAFEEWPLFYQWLREEGR